MKVVAAAGRVLEQIFDLTYPIWHEGLSRDAYERWNLAQLRTPWGAQHLKRFALVDAGGELLATAKRYRFRARIDGCTLTLCGLGAVFTPEDRRGRGYATTLIERLLEHERRAGADAAALFSEIGPAFYERLSFRTVPIDEVTVTVGRRGGAPAMLVRAGHESDLAAVAEMHARRSGPARFALERDPALIHYAVAKKRMLAGLGPMGLRAVEFHVVEEGASAVAYAVISTNVHGWTLDECGDRDPAGARLGALLQVLVAREPSQQPPLIRAWWPRLMPVPPQVTLRDRIDARDRLMMRSLTGIALPVGAGDAFYWRGDFF